MTIISIFRLPMAYRRSKNDDFAAVPLLELRCQTPPTGTTILFYRQNRAVGFLKSWVIELEKKRQKRFEFYLSLLSSASTKREAKAYLSRFKAEKAAPDQSHQPNKRQTGPLSDLEPGKNKPGVNLGNIFGNPRAVGHEPRFRQGSAPAQTADTVAGKLHVALVKVREPQFLDDQTVHGVAQTLSQLSRLGMNCCVVVDAGQGQDEITARKTATEQADRLSAAIDANHGPDSRRLDSLIAVSSTGDSKPSVFSRNSLLSPLRQGHIVVLTPIGYTKDTQRAVLVPANEVVLALTKELAGLELRPDPDEDATITANKVHDMQKQVSLDRLIILDAAGGIPSFQARPHVFVNLEQEFDDIVKELSQGTDTPSLEKRDTNTANRKMPVSSAGRSNPISKFVEEELVSLPEELTQTQRPPAKSRGFEEQLNNLKLLQITLSHLPPSSSGIIVTPNEVAMSAKDSRNPSTMSAVGTRRQQNPLIHNLLTDKPVRSASLPLGRLGVKNASPSSSESLAASSTFLKRGMPLTMLPDPRVEVWTVKKPGEAMLTLDDPRIDLPRLVHLIEDSFDRKLDVCRYIDRVNSRLAGLIIAGEYEGGAILTWETPPGGVADIVFNAMVRTCFPKGVCWRSRANNPVNKWYFERSRGTWKLPGTNWTMFWTTEGVPEDQQRFWDYEGVCRSIEPNWADNKQQVD
ncbi:conserved hypothetical protein [Uncinocarpus reesii 1704]|uniref:Amino-acid acetyltransferase, mitochondrial n=1 Tax=Uncinocarpus reesii (strain UAMH 1704) TaxID=336963 RepID=C4JFU7_UNCRE|nr:uncharacterized protein UREG_02431 [Uncinocarpus reesii 1704]EEP77582.1 conserved hypothetical protein [Uncinocarpus reesii 1704]